MIGSSLLDIVNRKMTFTTRVLYTALLPYDTIPGEMSVILSTKNTIHLIACRVDTMNYPGPKYCISVTKNSPERPILLPKKCPDMISRK